MKIRFIENTTEVVPLQDFPEKPRPHEVVNWGSESYRVLDVPARWERRVNGTKGIGFHAAGTWILTIEVEHIAEQARKVRAAATAQA